MNDVNLVSPCGLYCGECPKFKRGKCAGCDGNHKAAWCKVRTCTKSRNIRTCGDCPELADVNRCSKFNTIFSKFFYYVFKSDRKASLQYIRDHGIQDYADKMVREQAMVIKRR